MAVNQFVPFAYGAGSNVIDPQTYAASPERLTGFQSGVTPSPKFNRAFAQGTFMASMLGNVIRDTLGVDVLDNGDMTTIQNNYIAAILQLMRNSGIGTRISPYGYLSAGVYQISIPAWAVTCEVQLWGGGGAGGWAYQGNTAFGGAGGGYSQGIFAVARTGQVLIQGGTVTLVVGAGAPTTYVGTTSQNGGTSTFGSLMTCTGGQGGPSNDVQNGQPPIGGSAAGGYFNVMGGKGSSAIAPGTFQFGSQGGGAFGTSASQLGSGGVQIHNGYSPGGGGSGGLGASMNHVGDAGADGAGLIIFRG